MVERSERSEQNCLPYTCIGPLIIRVVTGSDKLTKACVIDGCAVVVPEAVESGVGLVNWMPVNSVILSE